MTLPIAVTHESERIAESPLLLDQLALFPFYIALRYFIVNDDAIYYTLLGRHEYDEILIQSVSSPSFGGYSEGCIFALGFLIGSRANETDIAEAENHIKQIWRDRINDIIENMKEV